MFSATILVSSFAFQVSGAIILLLWSLRSCDKTIKRMCLENSSIPWFEMDGATTVTKEDLQKNAKTVYLNIGAFVNILIGYTCAIFVRGTAIPPWHVFFLVVFSTVIILCVEFFISQCVAAKKYPCDQKVKI